MSTLPQTEPKAKTKTIAELAIEHRNDPRNDRPDPLSNTSQRKRSLGSSLNVRWEHELQGFVGKRVDVLIGPNGAEEWVTGTLAAISMMHLDLVLIGTEHKTIIRRWSQLRRSIQK